MNLLLLSSSRVGNSGYLEHALPHIKDFLADSSSSSKLLFVPYAGVSVGFDQYLQIVQEAFAQISLKIESIHQFDDKLQAIENASGIVIGGGNTFALLNSLYQQETVSQEPLIQESLLEKIKSKIASGTPYIGWSAGSNISAPTIRTTNDMPIVEPPAFDALNLVKWQINPHYIEGNPPGHNGETRQQRLEEFMICNPEKKVIAIPEGTAILLKKGHLHYVGDQMGYVFSSEGKKAFATTGELRQLLSK